MNRTSMKIVNVISAILCLLLFAFSNTYVYAQEVETFQISTSEYFVPGQFKNYSRDKRKWAVKNLILETLDKLGVEDKPEITFFKRARDIRLTYTVLEENIFYVCIDNLTAYTDYTEDSLEEFIKKTVAHECRHFYQRQHLNDDTTYAELIRQDYEAFVSFEDCDLIDTANYLETDAIAWAENYVATGEVVLSETNFENKQSVDIDATKEQYNRSLEFKKTLVEKTVEENKTSSLEATVPEIVDTLELPDWEPITKTQEEKFDIRKYIVPIGLAVIAFIIVTALTLIFNVKHDEVVKIDGEDVIVKRNLFGK